jgi:hypothetical protein
MAISKLSTSSANLGLVKYKTASDLSVQTDFVDIFNDESGVAYWKFDNNSNDFSGLYNGTASNVTYSTASKLGSHAAAFNGSSSNIAIPALVNYYPLSFSVWAQNSSGWAPSADGVQEILNMSIFDNSSIKRRLTLGIVKNPGWPTGPTVMYGNSNHWSLNSSSIFNGNTTSFFHLVYNVPGYNSAPTIYINGTSYSFTNNGGGHGGTAGFSIGSNGNGAEWWNGKLDNLRIFNKILSQSEVNILYNGGNGI